MTSSGEGCHRVHIALSEMSQCLVAKCASAVHVTQNVKLGSTILSLKRKGIKVQPCSNPVLNRKNKMAGSRRASTGGSAIHLVVG